MSKPVMLCILDGWGLREETDHNAPALAATPTMDNLYATCPHATLITHGRDVGLPSGQMGNSEVGHTNIGAGRVVAMDLGQIDLAIEEGTLGTEAAVTEAIDALRQSGGAMHIMGLASDGGVHSHIDHLIAAVRIFDNAGIPTRVHVFTDGRDVAPKSAPSYLATLARELPDTAVATLSGRYYAMDRDNRWDRVETAYRAIAEGKGPRAASASQAVEAAHAEGTTDEFIPATVIDGYSGFTDGDGLFLVNFRADRARELLAALGDPGFSGFDRGRPPKLAVRLGMVEYSTAHNSYMTTVFPPRDIPNTLGAWVAIHGKRQFHIAETEKYPHVTFFLNGGQEEPEPGETRYMAASPRVATYDLQPEMSAGEVTEHLIGAIRDEHDLIVVNYANPDMVGHTGDLDAAIAACEAVDAGLGQALAALADTGGAAIITADHGNCETMWDEATNGPHTAHTTNPVPVILFGGPQGAGIRDGGRLADLAPTVLELMRLPKPPEMTGESLIT